MGRAIASDAKRHIRSAGRDLASAKESLTLATKVVDNDSPSCMWHLEDVQKRLEMVTRSVEQAVAAVSENPVGTE